MNRRDLLKGLAAAGVLAKLPQAVPAASHTVLPVHFVGLGGAGCNGVAAIQKEQPGAFFTCITSPDSKAVPPGASFIPFTPRIPTALRPKEHNRFPPVLMTEMQQLLSQPHHFVLLAGLGGYTGTVLLQTFIRLLQDKMAALTAIASLPFRWEGPRRQAAEELLPTLQSLPRFYSFDLQQMVANPEYSQMKMTAFFQKADEQFYWLYRQALQKQL